MTGWMNGVGIWFWNEQFWLPANYTWEDMKPTQDRQYPDYTDIFIYPIIIAFVLLSIKNHVLYPYLLTPFGISVGLPNKRHRAPVRNEVLENVFKTYGTHVPNQVMVDATLRLQWSTRKVERWLRRKQASQRMTVLDKFKETANNWIFYLFFSVSGVYTMFSKPYLWDISRCWEGYPLQVVPGDLWWYYMVGLGFFWSISYNELNKPQRKDTNTMYLHHLFTILLMSFSWTVNAIRIGSLVLFVHSLSDVVLLLARGFKYMKYTTTTDALFAVFLVVWIATRVVLFPFWILHSILFRIPVFAQFPAVYFFTVLLFGLLYLDISWTVMIFSIIFKKIYRGELEDARSSDEFNSNEEQDAKDGIVTNHEGKID